MAQTSVGQALGVKPYAAPKGPDDPSMVSTLNNEWQLQRSGYNALHAVNMRSRPTRNLNLSEAEASVQQPHNPMEIKSVEGLQEAFRLKIQTKGISKAKASFGYVAGDRKEWVDCAALIKLAAMFNISASEDLIAEYFKLCTPPDMSCIIVNQFVTVLVNGGSAMDESLRRQSPRSIVNIDKPPAQPEKYTAKVYLQQLKDQQPPGSGAVRPNLGPVSGLKQPPTLVNLPGVGLTWTSTMPMQAQQPMMPTRY